MERINAADETDGRSLSGSTYLKSSGEELVFHFQVVAHAELSLKWLIYNKETRIILNICPSAVSMSDETRQ